MITGDTVIITARESAHEVAGQVPEIRGPPRYLTMTEPLPNDRLELSASSGRRR
jgi:hypothetical protein